MKNVNDNSPVVGNYEFNDFVEENPADVGPIATVSIIIPNIPDKIYLTVNLLSRSSEQNTQFCIELNTSVAFIRYTVYALVCI